MIQMYWVNILQYLVIVIATGDSEQSINPAAIATCDKVTITPQGKSQLTITTRQSVLITLSTHRIRLAGDQAD